MNYSYGKLKKKWYAFEMILRAIVFAHIKMLEKDQYSWLGLRRSDMPFALQELAL